MFWDDISEVKKYVKSIQHDLRCLLVRPIAQNHIPQGVLTEEHEGDLTRLENIEHSLEEIKESLQETLDITDDNSFFNRIHDKLNKLLTDEKRNEAVELASKTLDKFEDYMKNVDKLNLMVNEIKGLVSICRACLSEKKEFETLLQDIRIIAESVSFNNDESKKNAEYSLSLHNQHFKIDALYKELIEKKLVKKRPIRKKKVKDD